MTKYLILIFITIYIQSIAQNKIECLYVDPNILIIDCGEEDRYKLAEVAFKLTNLKAKVIVLDFIFYEIRPMDSVLIKRLTSETPVILSMGNKDDSSYFNIPNCYKGPRSIRGNKKNKVEFLFPIVTHNEKLRDSFEFLVLKYFDFEKYSRLKKYLTSFDLSKLDAKARIEFNGNSLSCFHSISINDFADLNDSFIEDKIVILGYFGTNPDVPLDKDKDRYAFKVRSTKNRRANYMYTTLISANIISNLIRKELRDSDLNRMGN